MPPRYCVYDLRRNEGWASVGGGIDHDTGHFAVNTIRRWWQVMGRARYPKATTLLVTADAEGSNGSRLRLWKWDLQAFANRTGLRITMSHSPPGTSKWNKIEHPLFSHIAMNWRGIAVWSPLPYSHHSDDLSNMRIEPATPRDLADIRAAYEHGRVTQRQQSSIVWPEFTDTAILGEIEARHLFRVVVEDATVGVFSVAYEDPAIWGSHERGAHLYLHRVARAALYPGRGLIDAILTWAEQQCTLLGREGLRMDTWASNTALIGFYQRHGFHLVGERRLGADPRLPPHYCGTAFALLERSCEP